jgi:hypothetical protein
LPARGHAAQNENTPSAQSGMALPLTEDRDTPARIAIMHFRI